MDKSFKARVRKIFGSLSSASSPFSPQSSSEWSLIDDEVEKIEWNQQKDHHNHDDETPLSSSLDGFFTTSAKINTNHFKVGEDDDDKDEWEIPSSIGLDCTLDNEEEEDEYDKVAEGSENAGDCLSTREDNTDHGPYLNSHNVLPNLVHDTLTDPSANNLAAQIRLKEDEAAAENFETDFDESMQNVQEPCIKASEDGFNFKSILKRKNNEALKSSKRVRFDLNFKDNCEASKRHQDFLAGAPLVETTFSAADSLLAKDKPGLPVHLLNPSKYTRYSLDSSSEIGEESNSRACMDFFELVKKSQSVMLELKSIDASTDLRKSVTFAEPVSCSSEVKPICEDGSEQILKQTSFPVGVAAEVDQQNELGTIQEDEP